MPTHPHTTTPAPPAAVSDSALSGTTAPSSALSIPPVQLSARGRAILRAVAGGGAELSVSCGPDLFLDGRCCSDQATARQLVRAGLITTISPTAGAAAGGRVEFGRRVAARLTTTGQQAVASATRPPADAPADALVGGGSR